MELQQVEEIIGKDETRELKAELNDMLSADGTTIGDIEELLLGYGLEMDYFECLLGF